MNKVAAATELQQLLKQNTSIFGEATAQKPLLDIVQCSQLAMTTAENCTWHSAL